MDGGDDMDSLFEGMELFTPSSSQFADSSENAPAILPPSKEAEATVITAPAAEAMSEPLDEDMFSDLTIVTPVQHVPEAVTHPSPLPSSSSSSSMRRQVSRRKKRSGGLRIGYGRHEINDDEDDDSVSQQSADSVGQLSDSVNQVTDSVSQQSDSVNQITDSVNQPSDSVVDQPLDTVKAQIEGKLTRARALAASVTATRKNAIRKRRQASENLRLASKAHDELEKQLEEAIEAEDFDAAEKISESLADAERDKLSLMALLRQAESDCDAIESKMEEVLLSQIAAEEESASLLRGFCTVCSLLLQLGGIPFSVRVQFFGSRGLGSVWIFRKFELVILVFGSVWLTKLETANIRSNFHPIWFGLVPINSGKFRFFRLNIRFFWVFR